MLHVQTLIEIAQAFDRDLVRFLIVGGLAVVAHGYMRLTQDIDVVVDFGEGNEGRAIAALKGLGFKPRVPEPMEAFAEAAKRQAWAATKDMLVFTVWRSEDDGQSEIGLFLSLPFDFDAAYAKALWKPADEAGTVPLPFVDLENLLGMKRQAGRPRDLDDIRNLQAIRGRA